jgi:glucose-1-phosphate adenylyltransferase
MNDVMGIINLSESEDNIKDLTLNRSLASIHILGRYRIIDFALSNMVNAGITNVAIYNHAKGHSLMMHLGSGKHWGLDRKRDGLFIFYPDQYTDDNHRRTGDLEYFKNHVDYLKNSTQPYVLMSRSYMIYNADFKKMVKYHKQSGADVTIAYKKMENSVGRFMGCDTLEVSEDEKIVGIGKNLGKEKYYNISLETYVMKRELLIKLIEDSIQKGDARFLKEAIMNRITGFDVKGWHFGGYLSCVNSTSNYFLTNMELLNEAKWRELFNENGKICTKVMDAPSTYYSQDSFVSNTIVANGCIIEGTVENSIICRDVHIKKGAIVRNSIIFPNVTISETTNLSYVILDKNVVINSNKMLFGDRQNPFVIKKNMVL